MNNKNRIFVAGHRGMVGSAVVRALKKSRDAHLITQNRAQLDLIDRIAVRDFFSKTAVDVVILCAAKVGGIVANRDFPADFIEQNLEIGLNVISEARRANICKLIFLGSSCIYPRNCLHPISEIDFLTGPLEPTNEPYAVAKIASIELCWSLNRQFNTRYLAVMPTNLYGLADNYHLEHSHVLPGLIRRIHEAKVLNEKNVIVWGTGIARREFLFSDDLADALIYLLTIPDRQLDFLFTDQMPPLINVGVGKDIQVRELAELVKEVVGFRGKLIWDKSKPDGTLRKLLSTSRMTKLGWTFKTSLKEGIEIAYQDFVNRLQ